jgi:D-3-phosphoglycerate dehydrogenase
MIGRVGTIFGKHGINIVSAAVGREPDGSDADADGRLAAMVITTDTAVPQQVLEEITASEGFVTGRTVTL